MEAERTSRSDSPRASGRNRLAASNTLATLILLSSSLAVASTTTSTSPDDGAIEETTADLSLDEVELKPPKVLARGAELFAARCSRCHGPEGRGDGPIARFLDPWPSDLTRGVFKLRSTPTGHPPTEADLFRTITTGIPGTAMPSWAGLSLEDRWQVVWFVSSLFERDGLLPPEPIKLPEPPVNLGALAAKGAGVYQVMQCARCHGTGGRGDGRDAFEIRDDAGRLVRPFDFSRSWKLKGGASPKALYRTLWTGLDGTGMPSFGDALSPNDTWALVAFVTTLFVDVRGGD
ncbi:MAG: c-type cytochrome [Deltaproteobacteria bacterium]|nr:c-type cytochrome [Deltaproteobacteria bacterium]